MNCKTVIHSLSPFLDGELTPDMMGTIKEHIAVCPSCSGKLESLMSLRNLFKSAEKVKAPENMAVDILSIIDKEINEQHAGDFFHGFVYRAVLTAASIIIFISGLSTGIALMDDSEQINTRTILRESYALASFDPLPELSIGKSYVSMMEAGYER